MAGEAPELKLKVTAEEQGVSQAINSLTTQLQKLTAQEKAAAEESLNLTEAFQGILEVLAVEKLIEFGKEIFDATNRITRLSEATGITTETLSVYSSAAVKAGASSEQVSSSVVSLAKTITLFEQGNQRAAKAIALTGLTLKDFQGLNADQKLRLVTDAIGRMPPGFAKQTVATKLLNDSSGEVLRTMNLLAGEGFDRVAEEAEKTGNIVGADVAANFEVFRKTLANITESSEGMVRQFEAGVIPALTDIANAIQHATTGEGASGFKFLGEVAGSVFKGIVLVIVGALDTIVRNFAKASADVQNIGKAVGDVFKVGFSQANANLAANVKADYARIDDAIKSREAAILAELDGTSRNQDVAAQRLKQIQDKIASANAKGAGVVNEEALKGQIKAEEQADALYAQRLAFLSKQIGQELDLYRAGAAQRSSIDQAQFDEGIISLTTYYDRRRKATIDEGNKEVASLEAQIALETKARDRAQKEQADNAAKAAKRGGASTPLGQEYAAAATKNAETVNKANQTIADLQSKIAITQVQNQTKLNNEDLAAFKAKQEQASKLAEFNKQILEIQGRTTEAAQAEANAKVQEFRTLLTSKLGEGNPQIDRQVQQYTDLITAQAQFNEARQAGDAATKTLNDQIAAIQDQVNQGKLFQIEADKQIRDLEASTVPILQSIADKQKQAALATGNAENVAKANDFAKTVQGFRTASNQAAEQAKTLREGIQSTLSGSFEQFLTQGIESADSVGAAFAGLADSVVSSLQKIVTQMLINIAIQKLLSAFSGGGGFSGGGLASSGGGSGDSATGGGLFAAEGGYISGPGGPTSDSIPAHLSDGEYVLRASAVSAIGVPLLEMLNRATRSPVSFSRSSVPSFAEGGLVGGSRGESKTAAVHLQVSLDKGIVLQHMASKEGAKVTINHLANNPKRANGAIGRSK